MFTKDDSAFLDALDLRAHARLSDADPTPDRLHAAIEQLRAWLGSTRIGQTAADQLNDLLDAVWWASCAGDCARARRLAASLAREVRELDLRGLPAMRVVEAAQQIRTLVVLAA